MTALRQPVSSRPMKAPVFGADLGGPDRVFVVVVI